MGIAFGMGSARRLKHGASESDDHGGYHHLHGHNVVRESAFNFAVVKAHLDTYRRGLFVGWKADNQGRRHLAQAAIEAQAGNAGEEREDWELQSGIYMQVSGVLARVRWPTWASVYG